MGVQGNACYMVVVTTTSGQSSIPFAYCTDMPAHLLIAAAAAGLISTIPAALPPLMLPSCAPSPPHVRMGRSSFGGARIYA